MAVLYNIKIDDLSTEELKDEILKKLSDKILK